MIPTIRRMLFHQLSGPRPRKYESAEHVGSSGSLSPACHLLILEVNVRRAEKLPLYPGYYFLMMSAFTGAARAEQPFNT